MTNSLKKACVKACGLLRKKGIKGLELVPVYFDWTDIHSGCFEEPVVKIGVGWAQGVRSLWDFKGCTAFMVHEYAHAMLYKLWPKLTIRERHQWEEIFGSYVDDPKEDPYPKAWETVTAYILNTPEEYNQAEFVSAYATVSGQEDWAETVAHYVLDADIENTPVLNAKVDFVEKCIRWHATRVVTYI